MTLKIEAGKRYVTRDGRVTTELTKSPCLSTAFDGHIPRTDGILGSYKIRWDAYGDTLDSIVPSDLDLISEYREPKSGVIGSESASMTQVDFNSVQPMEYGIRQAMAKYENPTTLEAGLMLGICRLALERLGQSTAEKPKETMARQVETIISEEYAKWHSASPNSRLHWHVSAAKRILREVVQPMLATAYGCGIGNTLAARPGAEPPSAYAARTIKEACGE